MKLIALNTLVLFSSVFCFAQQPVVGGNNATIEDFPYQISIQEGGSGFCGGTIVGSQWIITAAHCTEGETASNLTILAGVTDLTDAASGQTIQVETIFDHPDYNNSTLDNDISILKLSSPLSFNAKVQAIDWITPSDELAGAIDEDVMTTLSGWGDIQDGGPSSDILQTADLPIIHRDTANLPDWLDGEVNDNMIAAGYENGGKDACQGDSGGPLVAEDPENQGEDILVGVVSWGYGCADPKSPGIYARVANYDDWITSIIAGKPLAKFSGPSTFIINQEIVFEDLSVNAPTTWSWTITGPTSTTVNSEDLTFTFSQAGLYTIELEVSNGQGSSTVTKNVNAIEITSSNCDSVDNLSSNPTYEVEDNLGDTIAGNNYYDDAGVFEFFTNDQDIVFDEINLKLAHAQFTGNGSTITLVIMEGDNTNGPTTEVYSQEVEISDLAPDANVGAWSTVQLDQSVFLNVDYFIGVLFNLDAGNEIAIYFEQTLDNSSWSLTSGGSHIPFSDSFTWSMNTSLALGVEYCEAEIIASTSKSITKKIEFIPNPCSGIVALSERYDVQILDNVGRIVAKIKGTRRIDMGQFVDGTYTLHLVGNENTQSIPVVNLSSY